MITTHAANAGLHYSYTGTKRTSRHYNFVLIQSKRLGGSDYCNQSIRAIKSDNNQPGSNWQKSRAMRELSGATLPERALAAYNNSYVQD